MLVTELLFSVSQFLVCRANICLSHSTAYMSSMDLIQVGVSVTGSREKRILCVSPKAGPAQPAASSGPYI